MIASNHNQKSTLELANRRPLPRMLKADPRSSGKGLTGSLLKRNDLRFKHSRPVFTDNNQNRSISPEKLRKNSPAQVDGSSVRGLSWNIEATNPGNGQVFDPAMRIRPGQCQFRSMTPQVFQAV